MQKLHFTTRINATPEKVWTTMLGKEEYKIWTKPFNPAGSWYEGEMTEGSKIHFLGPDPEDPSKIGGMVSIVRKVVPNQFISFEHIGEIKNGVEDIEGEMAKLWAGAFENYTLTPKDGGTEVLIEVHVTEDFKSYMDDTWPQALEIVKEEAEK